MIHDVYRSSIEQDMKQIAALLARNAEFMGYAERELAGRAMQSLAATLEKVAGIDPGPVMQRVLTMTRPGSGNGDRSL